MKQEDSETTTQIHSNGMRIHLVNPSHLSFGIGVITPRWLYVIAAATPVEFGDPLITDETLERVDFERIHAGDIVGIGIHSGNAMRGYEVGKVARERGAYVVFGGIHTSLFPEESFDLGGAHAVVKGDGEVIWPEVVFDCKKGQPKRVYEGGKIEGEQFVPARWDLMPQDKYMWASVQTVRGCPKHCSFCSVWRTDGQRPRQSSSDLIIQEIVALRRKGFRFIALADDNFYPAPLEEIKKAESRNDQNRVEELTAFRNERLEFMARLANLPKDMIFFTQITMEASDDPEFLEAMRKAKIKGALVGIESVTPEGLKAVFKDFNSSGENLVKRLRAFREHEVYLLGSFIFGLPTDRPDTFDTTVALAETADVAIAQFVMLTPYPGTVDFDRWEKKMQDDTTRIAGHPLTRYWLIPQSLRPKMYMPHPVMSAAEIRQHTQKVWDMFYRLPSIWRRSAFIKSYRNRIAFTLLSKIYRQMYANTGLSTDSAREKKSVWWARFLLKPCLRLFHAEPMPELKVS